MSIKNRKFYSISPANARMFDILAEFEQEKRNVSDYICKAVIEKYDREKNTMNTDDMFRALMGILGSSNVRIPINQQTPVQQPIIQQEVKSTEAVETKQDKTDETSEKEEISFVPRNPIEALMFQD